MYWWIQLGFPPFDPWEKDQNYPDPGQVTKHYREQKMLVQSGGSLKPCRQLDLASILGVSESWVRAMENNSESFDSFSRRKALIVALNIPPILFGFVSIEDILKPQEGVSIPERIQQVDQTTLDWFQDSLGDSWELYYTGAASTLQSSVTRKIYYLRNFADASEGSEQEPFLNLKCRFHLLSARVAADQLDYKKAFAQLKQARELAAQLKSRSLLAAALFWRGRTYLERGDWERGDFQAAATALDKALTYVPDDQPQLKGATLLEGGLAHAYTASTPEEKDHALELFAQALEFAKLDTLESDGSFVKLTIGRYYHFKAEAYIAMGMPEEALETLDLAEEKTGPELTRRRAYINILRSQASLDMGDYPFAAHAALDAFYMCKAIGSDVNLAFIRELSSRLNKSPYANLEAVTQLRVALRAL